MFNKQKKRRNKKIYVVNSRKKRRN